MADPMHRRTSSRIHVEGFPRRIVQRSHNRAAYVFDDQDRRAGLGWLHEVPVGERCRMHADVLMTNHVHLLPSVGCRDVQYINHTYGRNGTLWDGRYKSSLVQAETYLRLCQRYVALNPVRAAISRRCGAG